MTASKIFLCNQPPAKSKRTSKIKDAQFLNYQDSQGNTRNVNLELPNFIKSVYHLPDRMLDLLEVAAYVYCGDRLTKRGTTDELEYHAWSRSICYKVKVRDITFWKQKTVKEALSKAVEFMSGDLKVDFEFEAGHSTPPTSLFDSESFEISSQPTNVLLFSGGLDSLAGAIHLLESSEKRLCLISHQSQPAHTKTQKGLFEALNRDYPGRVSFYRFSCSLSKIRAPEESQRTRSLLFNSIAFALAAALGQNSVTICENGVTSMNLPRREDLLNARASRTTHPKVIRLLEDFFTLVMGKPFVIDTPFFLKTKTDVVSIIGKYGKLPWIPSSISCSKTFRVKGLFSQCGLCYQCIDRRFAMYAAGMHEADTADLYENDFFKNIPSAESKTVILDYLRQALTYFHSNSDSFFEKYASELSDSILNAKLSGTSLEKNNALYELCSSHGNQIKKALQEARRVHDDIFGSAHKDSLFRIIDEREYLKNDETLLIEEICRQLRRSIPIAFQRKRPDSENHLNDHIEALLNSEGPKFEREYPSIKFGLAKTIPDHSIGGVLIESKFIRNGTTPSKVTEGLAADMTKYRKVRCFILFVIYDPDRQIADDEKFVKELSLEPTHLISIIR